MSDRQSARLAVRLKVTRPFWLEKSEPLKWKPQFFPRSEREGGTSSYLDENFTRFVRQPAYRALGTSTVAERGNRLETPLGISILTPSIDPRAFSIRRMA